MTKKIIGIAFIVLVALVFAASMASADNTPQAKTKNAWKKIVEYPANVTKESAVAVSDTAKKGTETVANTAQAIGEVATGQIEKTPDIVTEPIKGTAETAATAVSETATAPVKAAQE